MTKLTKAQRKAISDAARSLRAIPSAARSAASARNGALGGRPTSGLASDREVRRRARAWFMDAACGRYIVNHSAVVQFRIGLSGCLTSRDWVRYCVMTRSQILSDCPDRPCIDYVLKHPSFADIQHILLQSPVLL